MRRKKYTLFNFCTGDFKGVEQYLNRQAAKGWKLDKVGVLLGRFIWAERDDLRWCVDLADPMREREEEEEEANGGRETISARLKLAGCALAALVLLAYPSIQRFLAGGRSLAECVAEVIVRLMVVACVVFPVWRTVKRRQEENGTV